MRKRILCVTGILLVALVILSACRGRDPYGLNGHWVEIGAWDDYDVLIFQGIASPNIVSTMLTMVVSLLKVVICYE